jgi:hypothetical protein
MKKVLAFILKNFHWLVIAVCLLVWVITPHKPAGPMFAGAAAVGFIWGVIAFVRSLQSKPPASGQ